KSQTSSKCQAPNAADLEDATMGAARSLLEFGHWNLFGIWGLFIGISSGVYLKLPDGFEGVLVMDDVRLFGPDRPSHGQDIETCLLIQQAMFLEKPQCQLRQTPLFGMIDRFRRPN